MIASLCFIKNLALAWTRPGPAIWPQTMRMYGAFKCGKSDIWIAQAVDFYFWDWESPAVAGQHLDCHFHKCGKASSGKRQNSDKTYSSTFIKSKVVVVVVVIDQVFRQQQSAPPVAFLATSRSRKPSAVRSTSELWQVSSPWDTVTRIPWNWSDPKNRKNGPPKKKGIKRSTFGSNQGTFIVELKLANPKPTMLSLNFPLLQSFTLFFRSLKVHPPWPVPSHAGGPHGHTFASVWWPFASEGSGGVWVSLLDDRCPRWIVVLATRKLRSMRWRHAF